LSPTPKISFDVKRISLADRSGYTPPNIFKDDDFQPSIAEAVKGWAKDHLQAVGQTGQAIVVIKKAFVSVQPLSTDDGIENWFTRQQTERYTARAEISIEANGQPGFAVADAAASRSVTMPDGPSTAEKHVAYNTLLNGLMKDLQENLVASIHSHMATFIGSAPLAAPAAAPVGEVTQGGDQLVTFSQAPAASAQPQPQLAAQPMMLSPALSQSASQIVPQGNDPMPPSVGQLKVR
jgi:hypothetical protein